MEVKDVVVRGGERCLGFFMCYSEVELKQQKVIKEVL